MDTTLIDQLVRRGAIIASRRQALRGLAASTTAALAGGLFLADDDAAARRQQKDRQKHRNTSKTTGKKKKKGRGATAPPTTPPPAPPVNECEGKNWCVDRNQMCGEPFGSGKCLVEAGGGNICAEILFQAQYCTDCEEPACVGCRCVLAAGGGDRCNNGATGADFICVRPL